MRWFELTHELHVGSGFARWSRVALPSSGAVDEQDALLMQMLDVVRRTMNGIVRRERRREDPKAELEAFKRRYGGGRR